MTAPLDSATATVAAHAREIVADCAPSTLRTITLVLPEAEAEALYSVVQEWAEVAGYGLFPGGDPHAFTPDPECTTEAERAAHKAVCEAWDRGETVEGHGSFGLGGYTLRDTLLMAVRDRMRAAARG